MADHKSSAAKPAAAPAPAPKQETTPKPAPAGGDDTVHVEGGSPSRGAQVILTGEAQTAARGGLAGDIEGNTIAKKALEADGTVADGSTPDGSTLTGKPAADIPVTESAEAGGTVPAEPGTTRIESTNPQTEK